MFRFKKFIGMIMAVSLIIASVSTDVFAGELFEEIGYEDEILLETEQNESLQEEETLEETILETTEDDTEDTLKNSLEDSLEDFAENLSEDLGEDDFDAKEESGLSLSESEINDKQCLADTIEQLESEVEGIDYVPGCVYTVVDTYEEAEEIAEIYGITLNSYDCSVADYSLPEGVSVLDIVKLAADTGNNYPAVYANHIAADIQDEDVSYDYDEETELCAEPLEDDYELASMISDYLKVNYGTDDYVYNKLSSCYQWHHEAIGTMYAWQKRIFGAGETIAILSSGMNDLGADYKSNDVTSPFGGKVTCHYNVINGQTGYDYCKDDTGIGTYIASLIGANINDKLGIGVAPYASLINIKVCDSANGLTDANLTKGINKAKEKKATIIVIDRQFTSPTSPAVKTACDNAYKAGIAIFAGTRSYSGQHEAWPAAYDSVISVGATNKNGIRSGLSGYSKSLDIYAPGEGIYAMDKAGTQYVSKKGTYVANAIAAAEAALILSNKSNIAAFYDADGNPYTGAALVDALRNYMKASTSSNVVYLPKALGISTPIQGPEKPVFVKHSNPNDDFKKSGDDWCLNVDMKASYFDARYIVYAINGTKPTFKNGQAGKDCSVIDLSEVENSTANVKIKLSSFKSSPAVVKAIAVDSSGVCSPIVTYTKDLTGDIYNFKISCNDAENQSNIKVVPGKKLKFSAEIVPYNKMTKEIVWEVVKVGGTAQDAKKDGVSISKSGVVSTSSKTPIPASYTVKAYSKNYTYNSEKRSSNELSFTMQAKNVTSIKAKKSKVTLYRGNYDSSVYLLPLFNIKTNGATETQNAVYFKSSNPNVVSIMKDQDTDAPLGYIPTLAAGGKGGKAVITCYSRDGSGVKGSVTIEVIQNVTGITLGNNYNKVARGKSLPISYSLSPVGAKVKKITSWKIINCQTGQADKTIKISGGKVVTSKKTNLGKYKITAKVVNPDKSSQPVESSPLYITVIPETISKISLDKSKARIFNTNNGFMSDEEATGAKLILKVKGGEKIENKPNPQAFSISSSSNLIGVYGPFTNSNSDELVIGLNYNPMHTGLGNATITVKSLDGSNKKVKCTVTVVRPASSVSIAPAKTGLNMAVSQGKSLPLKAIVGEEYGKISNKKVKWEITSGNNYATINEKTGVLTAKKVLDLGPDYKWARVTVKATALDGSEAYLKENVYVYKNVGKLIICDKDGNTKSVSSSGTVCRNPKELMETDVPEFLGRDFYVKCLKTGKPLNISNNDQKPELYFSSSDYSLAILTLDKDTPKTCTDDKGNEYYIYKFRAVCTTTEKTGTAKLTVTTIDGSQSVSYSLKVVK